MPLEWGGEALPKTLALQRGAKHREIGEPHGSVHAVAGCFIEMCAQRVRRVSTKDHNHPGRGQGQHPCKVAIDALILRLPHRRFLSGAAMNNFCDHVVGGLPHTSDIYAFVVDGLIRYIGRTVDFAGRMGLVNYGSISPKNCYRSGQSTNCKINSHVLRAVKDGQTVALYILPTNDLAIETGIINAVQPAWNGRMA